MDLNQMYYMPDEMPKFVLLAKCKDGRYQIYESGEKTSDVIAKVLLDYEEGKDRDAMIQKIMDKIKAFAVIKK